jgi:predicted amidohydrolase
MSTALVSLLQIRTDDSESPSDRYQRVIDQLATIAQGTDGKKPDLIMLPEFWHCGAFNIEQSVSLATTFPGPISDDICDIAATNDVWIHAGSFVENINGSLFNTSLLVDGQGHIAATYKKIHLFGFSEGESKHLTNGDELVCVATPLGMTALTTCYDLRFPELFRKLNEKGATSILMTSGWPVPRIEHWNVLTKARAIENQSIFIACNGVGTNGDTTLGGNSVVIDAWGKVLNEPTTIEQVINIEIDLQSVNQAREKLPVLADRKL